MQNSLLNFIRTDMCPLEMPNNLSILQQYQWMMSSKYKSIIKLQCRQTGKSFLTIKEFIRDASYLKPNDTIIIVIKQAKQIEEKIKNSLLLELFNGYNNTTDINNLGIRVNAELKKIMLKNFEIHKEIKVKALSARAVDDNLENIRLFIEPLEQNKDGVWRGVLFNGVKLIALAETSDVSAAVRGATVSLAYFEEVGDYRSDIFTDIVNPTSIRQTSLDEAVHGKEVKGKMYAVLTLNQKFGANHWSYKLYIRNNIDNDQVTKDHRFGIDYYISEENSTLVQIGDLEKMFQYIQNGEKLLIETQKSRPLKYKVEYILDQYGEKIKDENSKYITDVDGIKKITYAGYLYNIKKTNIRGAGLEAGEDAYLREYRMIPVSQNKTFSISEKNIIKRSSFDESNYKKIIGFDSGVESKSFEVEIKNGDSSASCIVEVAMEDYGAETQYIVYNSYYIKKPTTINIFNNINNYVLNRLPVVIDNALLNGTQKDSYNRKITQFSNILLAGGKSQHDALYNPNNLKRSFVFKSYKNTIEKRVKEFNDMLCKEKTESGKNFKNHENPDKKGYKLMITDNNVELIEYLNYQNYKDNGDLQKARDDLWDACWYALSFYEREKQLLNNRFYKNTFVIIPKKKINSHQDILNSIQVIIKTNYD